MPAHIGYSSNGDAPIPSMNLTERLANTIQRWRNLIPFSIIIRHAAPTRQPPDFLLNPAPIVSWDHRICPRYCGWKPLRYGIRCLHCDQQFWDQHRNTRIHIVDVVDIRSGCVVLLPKLDWRLSASSGTRKWTRRSNSWKEILKMYWRSVTTNRTSWKIWWVQLLI
jgi:hypothetical protein